MKEIERRLGLGKDQSDALKQKLDDRLTRVGSVARTVLVNVNGEGFVPDPSATTDVKVKLIGDDSILSVKRGSWHSDAAREEYEINFRRADLANVIGATSVLGSNKFILLSTLRTSWQDGGLTHTLDEYSNVGQSLYEIEASGELGEEHVNQAFADLGVTPMTSAETIDFIGSINEHPDTQIDLAGMTAAEVAVRMLEVHPNVG